MLLKPLRLAATVFALAALAAQPAAAGTFHAYGIGLNGSGCGSGWNAQSVPPEKFRQSDRCTSWDIESTAGGQALANGQFAGASMYAAPGTRFTGFAIQVQGEARNGVVWEMAMCQTYFTGCQSHFPRQGDFFTDDVRLGSLGATGVPYDATHLYAGIACREASCPDDTDGPGRAGRVSHSNSHVVVEDYTAPGSPSLSGVAAGWNSGQKQLGYSASDTGSGIESVTLTIDGSLHRTNSHSCLRLPDGGYSRPAPCVTDTGGEFALNEPGQLADGKHSLVVTSRDAGGESASASQEFMVDNNAPGQPLNLAVVDGDGWRGRNDFSVTWQNPDQGTGSPVAGVYYKIGSAPTTPEDGTRVTNLSQLDGLNVPGDGVWPLYLWLRDEAGNANQSRTATVDLRLDTTAPSLAFPNDLNEHNPTEIRVATSDATSGVAGGQIDIRRQGIAEWQPLQTNMEGTELVATVPDDQLERGTYELQATAWDAVGNRATTQLRADGRQMVVDLPLRGDTHVNATLARGAEGANRALPEIRVGYGKPAWLRGVLRSGSGGALSDTRVTVFVRPATGGEWQPFTELVTNGEGRYALELPAGPSRELMVQFPGTRSLRPANDVAKLLVRGWASLKLTPKRLRRGGTLTFHGRVGLLGAALPAGGKLIQIQYLDGRKWRPAVKLGHTDDKGRFAIKYRFRRISRPTKILFRILVPAEGGWPYVTGASKLRKAFVRP